MSLTPVLAWTLYILPNYCITESLDHLLFAFHAPSLTIVESTILQNHWVTKSWHWTDSTVRTINKSYIYIYTSCLIQCLTLYSNCPMKITSSIICNVCFFHGTTNYVLSPLVPTNWLKVSSAYTYCILYVFSMLRYIVPASATWCKCIYKYYFIHISTYLSISGI